MIIFLKKIVKRLLNFPVGYVSIGYNWSDSFKDYIQNLLFSREERGMSFLGKKNFQLAISLFLKNVFLIPRKNEATLIKKESLFNKKEIRMQKIIFKKELWTKMGFPFSYFDANIYFYHNGLRLFKYNQLQSFVDGKIAVDIGAYNGDSAFIFSKYNFKKIFCFELDKENLEKIKEHIKIFSLDKIECFQYAVSDQKKSINYSSNHTASKENECGEYTTTTIDLDSFLKNNKYLSCGNVGGGGNRID